MLIHQKLIDSIQLFVVAGLIDSDQWKPYDTTKRLGTPQHAEIIFSSTISYHVNHLNDFFLTLQNFLEHYQAQK